MRGQRQAGPPRRSYHQRRKEEQAAQLQRELERAWLEPQVETTQREPAQEARPARYAEITTETELIAAVGMDGMKFTQTLREMMK
ncbi:hypothetical protein [Deinococcus fonticola]|uniref:hypothetical protein n=1 Tax=Deinococcus fonticola TaxID=2528713 RepID=UPI001074BDFF|nr:hypothetical protein [Deinococcus fonticola]